MANAKWSPPAPAGNHCRARAGKFCRCLAASRTAGELQVAAHSAARDRFHPARLAAVAADALLQRQFSPDLKGISSAAGAAPHGTIVASRCIGPRSGPSP